MAEGITWVRPVRWRVSELELVSAEAELSGLNFNAWVRRACRERAELERSLRLAAEQSFRPDFK